MPQHLADGFNGNSLRERDKGSECVAGLMVREVLIYLTLPVDFFKVVQDGWIFRNGEDFSAGSMIPVFLYQREFDLSDSLNLLQINNLQIKRRFFRREIISDQSCDKISYEIMKGAMACMFYLADVF